MFSRLLSDVVAGKLGSEPSAPQLSEREREILRWIRAGKSVWETGRILSLSEKDVRQHLDGIRSKIAAPPADGSSPAVMADDPMKSLSATELGAALGGLSDETVRQRERARELFSVLRPGRKRGREYPAFKAWPEIAGEPLQRVLQALGLIESSDMYGFFVGKTDLLGDLTPVEALVGKLARARELPDETRDFLRALPQERLAAVVAAARAHAATRAE